MNPEVVSVEHKVFLQKLQRVRSFPGVELFNSFLQKKEPENITYLSLSEAKALALGFFRLSRGNADEQEEPLVKAVHYLFPNIRIRDGDVLEIAASVYNTVTKMQEHGFHPPISQESRLQEAIDQVSTMQYLFAGYKVRTTDDPHSVGYVVTTLKENYTSVDEQLAYIFEVLLSRDSEKPSPDVLSINALPYVGKSQGYIIKYLLQEPRKKTGSYYLDKVLERVAAFTKSHSLEEIFFDESVEFVRTYIIKQLIDVFANYATDHDEINVATLIPEKWRELISL